MTTLGEYIKVQGGYAYKSKDFIEFSKNKVLKIKNVRFGTIDYAEPAYVSDEIAESTKNWKVKEGDVLISMTGSGPNAPQSLVGRVARVWKNEPDAWINQRVGRICLLDEDSVHLDFIFYWLSLPQSQDYLVSNSSGSANQANISGKTIESLPCPKVDYQTSKQIADLARKFDEKVILNSKTNQTLEEMAQAIFKSWFVDFDPVKAKMNGEQPEGMDEATASLFPDKLVESELGLIPEGWDIATIKDFGSVVCGKTPSKKNADFYGGDVPFIKIPDTHGKVFITETTDTLTQAGDESQPKKRIPENSICVSCIATVGQVFITTKPSHTNQQINSVVPHDANSLYYLLFKFKGQNKHFHDLASGGSATLNMNTRTFSNVELVRPTADVMEAFHNTIGGLMQKMLTNQLENATLAELRDTLLPKLLSGEIELGTSEELVEAI
ncbi:TPA: restriction endonuclease subunit S [Vibrio cholerae]|nr:restriction endonuclease subunit S [Vibrio cholerae]